jgi:CheY-like chemotaxis protein
MDLIIESNLDGKALLQAGRENSKTDQITKDQGENKRRIFKNKVRVLLVEDNKVNQLVAEALLSAYGLDVVIADNGKEALKALTKDEEALPFSLALMDCHMPEMDGYDTTRNIRAGKAGDKYKYLPIVAMTANAMQGDREKCLQAGMDDYVTKPINETLLQNALLKWIKSSNTPSIEPQQTIESKEHLVWNQNTLLDRVAGDEKRLESIIQNYFKVSEQQKQHFIDTITNGDIAKIKSLTTSVKNSFNQLGGEELAHILSKIEDIVDSDELERVDDFIKPFEEAHIKFTKTLRAHKGVNLSC